MTKKTGASFDRGNSRQDYVTPQLFISAVEARFGELDIDLAADSLNRKCERYIGPQSELGEDSLLVDWLELQGNLWLNPPFGKIAAWAAKCATTRNRAGWLHFLAPSSTGSNWFQDHVAPNAFVSELVGRITFVGETQPYPKDCVLCSFGFGLVGRSAWRWKK